MYTVRPSPARCDSPAAVMRVSRWPPPD